MNETNQKEFNELCAKVLGYELITPDMRKNPQNWKHSYWESKDEGFQKVLSVEGSLSFHQDWNLLMKVVDKIESLGFDIAMQSDFCIINKFNKGNFFGDGKTRMYH